MMSRRPIHNSQGFTLLEVMMALGLSALIAVAVFVFYTSFSKQLTDLGTDIEASTDLESGQRIMLRDLKNIDVSFGVVAIDDDFGKNFFDVFPDISEDNLDSSLLVNDPTDPTHKAKRSITLKKGGQTQITVLLLDPNASPLSTLNFDPSWAYDMGPNTVTWNPAKHKNAIFGMRGPFASAGVVTHPGYWVEGQLLMYDVTSVFRSPSQLQQRNKYPPRPPFFIGRVNGNSMVADAQVKVLVKNNTNHPVNPSYDITSAHDFLWGVPTIAGGMPSVRLRPVRMVRYLVTQPSDYRQDEKDKGMMRLYRQGYTKGTWSTSKNYFMIADKIKSVRFFRNSIVDKTVLFDISR
jgi:prepilin-type N-terminal cleavage/methylation domain-containing protein